VQQVQLVLKDFRETLEPLVQLEVLVLQAQQVQRVLREFRATLEQQGFRATRALLDQRVLSALLAMWDLREPLVLLVQLVRQVQREQLVLLAQQDFRVYLLLDEFITSRVQQAIFLHTKN
jgi:hypothetical protein